MPTLKRMQHASNSIAATGRLTICIGVVIKEQDYTCVALA